MPGLLAEAVLRAHEKNERDDSMITGQSIGVRDAMLACLSITYLEQRITTSFELSKQYPKKTNTNIFPQRVLLVR